MKIVHLSNHQSEKINSDAVSRLETLERNLNARDSNDSFKEYVGQELKRFCPLDQALLKREITDLITKAELKRLSYVDPF